MRKAVVTVFDKLAKSYMDPFVTVSVPVTLRDLAREVLNKESMLGLHTKDMQLVKLGDFDSDEGTIVPHAPTVVCELSDLLPKEPQNVS